MCSQGHPRKTQAKRRNDRVAQQRKDWACRKAHTISAVMITLSWRWALQLLSDLPPRHLCWLPKWPSPLSAQMQRHLLALPAGKTKWIVQCSPLWWCWVDITASTVLCPSSKTGARHFQFSFNTLITPSTNLQDLTNKQLHFSSLKIPETMYHGDTGGRSPALEVSQVVRALGIAYRYFWASIFVSLLQSQFLLGNMTLKDPK